MPGVPYHTAEDKKILKYIMNKKLESQVSGNTMWERMEQDQVCPNRTWQSLKNRFKRYIKSDVGRPEFGLTAKEIQNLRLMWGVTTLSQGGWYAKPLVTTITKKSSIQTTEPTNEFSPVISDSSEDEEVKPRQETLNAMS